MCGIVGVVGVVPAAPVLLAGLEKLEYRGYDSAGVALLDGTGLTVVKEKGRLEELRRRMAEGTYRQQVGIGHTRWATHGKPSRENAHPHVSTDGRWAVVHNGIIENYALLRKELTEAGAVFASETDSEVVAQLLMHLYKGNVAEAVKQTVSRLQGSFALAILAADRPEELWAVRKASPLIIGLGDGENLVASDIPALLSHTRRVIRLADGEMARVTAAAVAVTDFAGSPVEWSPETVTWDVASAEKGGYAHFMLKEIMEQPRALADTMGDWVTDGVLHLPPQAPIPDEYWHSVRRMAVVACGSAYHAGLAAKYALEACTGWPVEVEVASEFRYRNPPVDASTLTVIISQSGETADTLAALREAKSRGSRVVSVVNVVGSTIAQESDDVLYTRAGPEIAVATTKGYTTQVCTLYLLAIYAGKKSGKLTAEQADLYLRKLSELPEKVEELCKQKLRWNGITETLSKKEHLYFIGRHLDYAVAMEASLKLKEISYIHSEAYAAGELKHGTISLIEKNTPVIALACRDELLEKMQSNIREIKARGALTLVVTTPEHAEDFPEAEQVLTVAEAGGLFGGVPETVLLQRLAYEVALAKGCDIDKPRNLAKSVTVE